MSYPLNYIASSKPPPKYSKDIITSSWYYTGTPQRLTNKTPISNNPGIFTKTLALNTEKKTGNTESPSDSTIFLSPPIIRESGTARASPPVLGRPQECSHLSGVVGSNTGGSTNQHHYLDAETSLCQVFYLSDMTV